MSERPRRIGVLALQGGFAPHLAALARLGADGLAVRIPGDLDGVGALIVPGGESTVLMKGMAREGLDGAITERVAAGMPYFGTCAGMIVADRDRLGLLDVRCERNASGRQRHSFEADVHVHGIGTEPLRAVFIRAPAVAEHGPDVEVLARHDDEPVVVRQGSVLACSFHPELSGDDRLHAMFMALVPDAAQGLAPQGGKEPSSSGAWTPGPADPPTEGPR
ncbi:MAG: pyridoxal 5'-phosphate synthase glutaminase subunit PdxT [Solirubrobacterales bacterium]